MGDTNVDSGYDSVMAKRNSKANSLLKRGGYKSGGAVDSKVKAGVHQHEKHMHKGEKETKLHLKRGGVADGEHGKQRIGKYARGGPTSSKKGTTVNVVIAGSGGQQQPPQRVPVPVPAGPPPGMPPRPPMGAAPAAPGGMPPARPPMNTGGRIKKLAPHKYDAGSGGGLGRLEKAKEYGAKKRTP